MTTTPAAAPIAAALIDHPHLVPVLLDALHTALEHHETSAGLREPEHTQDRL